MAAPKGNEYYLLRSSDGRSTEYTPESLLTKANEYFNWCLHNPLKAQKAFHNNGKIVYADENKMRPFALQGFCNYADIVINTFKNYESIEIKEDSTEEDEKKAKDFLIVTTRIRGIIENQQFEGAAAGFLNPNIIARKLGLADKKEVKTEIIDISFED